MGGNPGDYEKIQPLPRNYVPLYDPEPITQQLEVQVGDVGYYEDGAFRRSFSIIPDAASGNSSRDWQCPEMERLPTESAKDIVKEFHNGTGEQDIWCSRGLSWRRVDAPELSAGHLRYEIEKTTDKRTYFLISPRPAMVISTTEDGLEKWKAHMDRIVPQWAKNSKSKTATGEFVLVVGAVKTSQWVRLELKARGKYTLDVNPESIGSPTLHLDGTALSDEGEDLQKAVMAHRSDPPESYFNNVRQAWIEKGLDVGNKEFSRKHCLFLSAVRLKKRPYPYLKHTR